MNRQRRFLGFPIREWELHEWLICLLPVGMLIGLASVFLVPTDSSHESVHVGEQGTLCHLQPAGPVDVGLSVESFDKLYAAISKNDQYGIRDLEQNGDIWLEKCDTKVLVLDNQLTLGALYDKVRILSGPDEGRSGWVVSLDVKSAKSK